MSEDDEEFRILRVGRIPKDSEGEITYTNWYAVFNVTELTPESIITLEVPKGKEGLFAGTGMWQRGYWCEALGVKSISIVGTE